MADPLSPVDRFHWRRHALSDHEIPIGFIQLGVQQGGFMVINVDVIASYGPMSFLAHEQNGIDVIRLSKPEPNEYAGGTDFLGTELRLLGDRKTERIMVLHEIGEISAMCLAAQWKVKQCRT